jgi:hypothetical protein
MQKKLTYYSTALLSLFMSAGVVCSGAHSKDVVMYANPSNMAFIEAFRKQIDDSSSLKTNAKVSAELHNHIEKQTLKTMVKHLSDQAPQADTKSLKRVKPVIKKRHSPPRGRWTSILRAFAHS